MQMKNLVVGCALGALMASTAAWAGLKASGLVRINTVTRNANGSYGSARASADQDQYISCSVVAHSSGSSQVICEANDVNNTFAACTTSVPAMVAAVSSQSGDSFISFNWDASGACTTIYITNGSYVAPLQP